MRWLYLVGYLPFRKHKGHTYNFVQLQKSWISKNLSTAGVGRNSLYETDSLISLIIIFFSMRLVFDLFKVIINTFKVKIEFF